MRQVAGGLLVVMAALFLASRHLMGQGYAGWEWPRAFAEAAMVGALADWFAVTALFRHPLGLPIPHTAIIPPTRTGWPMPWPVSCASISSSRRWCCGG
jgi:uncharacterized membrane-anchored protein YjiN (DUF445 family)